MELNEFQAWAVEAVTKPGLDILYWSNALCGEAGETANQIKKMYRDEGAVLLPERKAKIVEELGDTLYYAAVLADRCGASLDNVADALFAKHMKGA